ETRGGSFSFHTRKRSSESTTGWSCQSAVLSSSARVGGVNGLIRSPNLKSPLGGASADLASAGEGAFDFDPQPAMSAKLNRKRMHKKRRATRVTFGLPNR